MWHLILKKCCHLMAIFEIFPESYTAVQKIIYVKNSCILMEMEGSKRLSLLIFLLAVQIVNDSPYIPDHLSPDLADLLRGLLCKGGFLLP